MTARTGSAGSGESKPRASRLAIRLWRDYLGRYWPILALSLVAMAVNAAAESLIPIGVEWIQKGFAGAEGPFRGDVRVWGPALILGLGLVTAGSHYVQSRLSASAALRALRDLQNAMFAKLLVIDDAQLRAIGAGQSIGRLTNDATVLRETLARATAAARDGLRFVALCAVMIWYDWALFVIVAAVYAAIAWPIARIGGFLRKSSREAQSQTGDIASLVGEAVGGGRMIRTYSLEALESARAERAFNRRLAVLERMAHLRALNEPFIFAVGAVALAVVIFAASLRIGAGALDASEFFAFLVALLLLSQPARGLSTLNAVLQEGLGAFERMLDVIDLEPRIKDRPGATPLRPERGAISFHDVRFSYGEGVGALNGFSLEVPAGARVALVGESGAGKSTVFALLARLYEPQAGVIAIDGAPIADATIASLRASLALVSQETILFNDTVRANIGFGKPGATQSEIVEAARAAAADSFIRALPQGYETIVGEGGQNLSGGQRQRLAVARAFLKNAPILLFDEATSALDAESEALIQNALDRLAKGRTTLVIAHRLATVRDADLIAAMDGGRVVEIGTHRTLLAKAGLYSRLASLQFREKTEPAR